MRYTLDFLLVWALVVAMMLAWNAGSAGCCGTGM